MHSPYEDPPARLLTYDGAAGDVKHLQLRGHEVCVRESASQLARPTCVIAELKFAQAQHPKPLEPRHAHGEGSPCASQ